ncbi:DNA topoisomerase-1 [Yoonia maricola]|uniref:DNA topoisomerase n=1 Tax=Yoonia maricola TaxID=420999 RepID=A0A2M8W0P4_9RHOB|nr:DNA topoisomerase IB [Yoonia maricola]PJI84487.1 DNA topoisomerase-1 [Yoonia maricola]
MSAEALVYYPDTLPGYGRRRCGRGFTYLDLDGATLRDATTRAQLKSLAVPPAYTDVWYCPDPLGHLLATGRDAKGRKQYIYHPSWTEAQAEAKFDGLADFGACLPRLRRRLQRDLAAETGTRDYALAAAVTLIDRTAIRLGSPQYAEENGSYGALTLREKHIDIAGSEIELRYDAKGGQKVQQTMKDAKLAGILDDLTDLPGRTVLTWVDSAGAPQTLTSGALNTYIAEAAGIDGATAKSFRTWIGSCAAFEVACAGPATITQMATAAADVLHNTPTIARNSYIHPAIIDLAGQPAPDFTPVTTDGLRVTEQRLLGFLQDW